MRMPHGRARVAVDPGGQSRARAVRSASARRSALRADFPAVLGPVARRATRSANGVRCARTGATSQFTKRADARGHGPCVPRRLAGALRPARARLGGPAELFERITPVQCVCMTGLERVPKTASSARRSRPATSARHRGVFAAGGIRRGRFLGRRGTQERGRRAQRASWSDSPHLFERSERSSRSELCGATPLRVPQRSRRGAPTATA